jgi:DNA-binding HxlR family transcriptional regulator
MASPDARECSIARTLELIGERWSLLAIRELMLGSTRFDQIVRFTGAPRDVLTARLRKLEEAGFIERHKYQDRPARYEYHLTERGRSLLPVITVLRDWGDRNLARPEGPPMPFEHTCGEALHTTLACSACGAPIRWGEVTALPHPGSRAAGE